jgi:hypothetical protein
MGNDSSVLKECAIDETPIYKNGTEFSLHHAQRIEDKCQLSVFISKDHVGDRKNLLEMMGKVEICTLYLRASTHYELFGHI